MGSSVPGTMRPISIVSIVLHNGSGYQLDEFTWLPCYKLGHCHRVLTSVFVVKIHQGRVLGPVLRLLLLSKSEGRPRNLRFSVNTSSYFDPHEK